MWSLLKKLGKTAPLLEPGTHLGARCKQAKYIARGLACPAATAEWLQILEAPALALILRQQPGLYQKLQRPYLTSRFQTAQRLEALRHHYRYVRDHFSPSLVGEIHSPAGRRLAILPVEDSAPYELRLTASRFEREGELAVALVNPAGQVMFDLTFSIVHFEPGHGEIMIGGLQGNKSVCDKDLIVFLTRQWHGLRPKALLLFAVHQLAAAWDVTNLCAVSDETHIYRHWRKRKEVASSYDEWWTEAGGVLSDDGLFELPARFVARDIATIKVNKRQLYRRRYQMLATVSEQIFAGVGAAPALPAAFMFGETARTMVPIETSPVPAVG